MVLGEVGQVVVPAPLQCNELAVGRIFVQHFALAEMDQPVTRTMQDENRAGDLFDEKVSPDLVSQHPLQGQPEPILPHLVQK